VLKEPSNSKDKWLTFMAMLLESWQTKNYFAYKVKYTKEKGVIAIDTNASPIHLAIAEVSKTGELQSYQTISLHHLIGLSKNAKDYQEWILAHQKAPAKAKEGSSVKGSGSDRGQSRLHLSYRHAKVCTTVKHR
jgi:hypothetical protein